MEKDERSSQAVMDKMNDSDCYGSTEEFTLNLNEQFETQHKSLEGFVLQPKLTNFFSQEMIKKYSAVPFMKQDDVLHLAMSDPNNILRIDEIERTIGLRIRPYKCEPEEIERVIKEFIEKEDTVTEYLEKALKGIENERLELLSRDDEVAMTTDADDTGEHPEAADLVDKMILQAVKSRTSDIHFEPHRDGLLVRLRIDGVLHKAMDISNTLKQSMISRIKVMSGMDIAERRIPQDGRVRARIGSKDVDIRVSTLPIFHGEKVVMRILNKSAIQMELSDLGFEHDSLQQIHELIHKPNGIFLVTGPTGSGKSTTLYACLNILNSISKNITTTEDPVEYEVEGLNQTQVNPKAGLTFAAAMRSILRQDPDIIMVGEMRDAETIQMAGQAALTGHLVVSTLHTNDAPGAVTRLVDMEMEPFLICSTVIGVLAQRLVRAICPACKEPYPVSEEMLAGLPLNPSIENNFMHGRGCQRCLGTGYTGRSVISEIFTLNDEIRELILKNAPLSQIKSAAKRAGMRSLREDGVIKAQKGVTTIEEVMAITTENVEE